jgi:hypothetical protein
MKVSIWRLRIWAARLHRLQEQIEAVAPDEPSKLENLVQYAAEHADDEIERMSKPVPEAES